MLALWLLMNNPNMTVDEAIQFVRSHRPGSINPGTQEEFLRNFRSM